MRQLIKEIKTCVDLYMDTKTGIAWIENGNTGSRHSCHPNIDKTGSVAGMKKLGYWNKEDKTVKSHGFIYNIDNLVIGDELDEIVRHHCQCGGKH